MRNASFPTHHRCFNLININCFNSKYNLSLTFHIPFGGALCIPMWMCRSVTQYSFIAAFNIYNYYLQNVSTRFFRDVNGTSRNGWEMEQVETRHIVYKQSARRNKCRAFKLFTIVLKCMLSDKYVEKIETAHCCLMLKAMSTKWNETDDGLSLQVFIKTSEFTIRFNIGGTVG